MLRQIMNLRTRWQASLAKSFRVTKNFQRYKGRTSVAQKIASYADEEVRASAAALEVHGHTELSFTSPNRERLLAGCRAIIAERECSATRTGKGFFAQLLISEDFKNYPALLSTALDSRVLETIATSYGKLPYLESIELLASYPTGKTELMQSQLWHRDETDSMVVKQLIYIEDVGADEGPFALIPPHESGKVSKSARHYLSDNEIEKAVSLKELAVLSGSAGSRYLVDTGRCYHYGSRVKKPRYALFVYYNTGYGKYPRLGRWDDKQIAEMDWTRIQRAVLDLE